MLIYIFQKSIQHNGKIIIPKDILGLFISIAIELYIKHFSLPILTNTFNQYGKLKFDLYSKEEKMQSSIKI